ncbi:MAG TPA: ATP-binding protein, partial [Herpetosiphonaceae bacterium]
MNTHQRRLSGLLRHPASDELLRLRLSQVVGREREIAAIRDLIERQAAAGGYVLISGGPGAGKSCLLAALVGGDGPERAPCHFVALRPAPGYQLEILQTLVARLALKHELADGYVPLTSYPALRDYFAALLQSIAARGRREVIYIDGLDQLPADAAGQRDLSFLPATPPPGIVLVLSARPEADGAALALAAPALRYDV